MAGPGRRLGNYGFGAAAQVITQVATHQGREVYAFVAPGDDQALRFAREVGAVWAGPSNEPPPVPLESALIFAPVSHLVPEALSRVTPGGIVVCAGIHMSDIPFVPLSVAVGGTDRSVGGQPDACGCRGVSDACRGGPLHTHVHVYPLADANLALSDLRAGRLSGAAVLVP